MIECGGFRIERVETGHMQGPKPMTFMYEGSARPESCAPPRSPGSAVRASI